MIWTICFISVCLHKQFKTNNMKPLREIIKVILFIIIWGSPVALTKLGAFEDSDSLSAWLFIIFCGCVSIGVLNHYEEIERIENGIEIEEEEDE